MKHAPIVIQIYEKEIQKADLIRELKIDKHDIDHEILKQPSKYVWWATVYAKVSEKVDSLQEKLDFLESKLYVKYQRDTKFNATAIKNKIRIDPDYVKMLRRLRHWKNSERTLKGVEKAFTQRASMLQSYAANTRRERKATDDD